MRKRIKIGDIFMALTVLSLIFMFGTGLEVFPKAHFKLSLFIAMSLMLITFTVITWENR